MKLWTVLLAGVLAIGATMDAEAARRLGGGGSFGRQSPNVTQRQATPPATPAAPTTAQQRNANQPAAAPTPATQPRRGFGGMLAGLAAGLGLAWLAHTLGFGEAFANILMFALLAMVVMAVIGMVMRRRAQGANAQRSGLAYQGAGASADAPASPRQYNPAKVGNDASARPWEDPTSGFGESRDSAAGGVRIGSALGTQPRGALEGSQNWGVPPGFDADGFLVAAKRNFTTLQDAWDRSDMSTLRSMMTDEMLGEIRNQMAQRDREPVPAGARTEVVMLEAQLLGIEELATEYMASVEFSGMIREEPSAGPAPFREVWNMVKPKDGSAGWLVAGVQALQ
jgi:predicted lipid-binding transport protein (Tim44 family)